MDVTPVIVAQTNTLGEQVSEVGLDGLELRHVDAVDRGGEGRKDAIKARRCVCVCVCVCVRFFLSFLSLSLSLFFLRTQGRSVVRAPDS